MKHFDVQNFSISWYKVIHSTYYPKYVGAVLNEGSHYKPVESDLKKNPLEVTKTSFVTNCDHSKNYVQWMWNLQEWIVKNKLKRWLAHFDVQTCATKI